MPTQKSALASCLLYTIYLPEAVHGIQVQALVGACEHLESDLSIFINFSRCLLLFEVGHQPSPVPIGVVDEKRSTDLVNQV